MRLVSSFLKVLFKLALPLAIVGFAVMTLLQLKASRPEAQAIEAPEKQWPVTAQVVQRGNHQPQVKLFGVIESRNRSTLSAAVAGEIIEVPVREGALVRKGQLLVVQDSRDLELALRQRQSEMGELRARIASEILRYETDQALLAEETNLLTIARRNLSRAEKLAQTKAGAQSGVDDARQVISTRSLAIAQRKQSIEDHGARLAQLNAGVERAEALIDQVKRDLERTRINAPFDGRVTEVLVAPGERARAGDRLITLFDTNAIEVRAQLPEKYLPAIRASLQNDDLIDATISLESTTASVSLKRLAGQVRAGQGGLDGFFEFDQPLTRAEIGRVVSLEVSLPAVADTMVLPVTALYGSNTVYRVVEGRLENVDVEYVGETARADEKVVIITSAVLAEGDNVLVTQLPAAVNGLKVAILDQ